MTVTTTQPTEVAPADPGDGTVTAARLRAIISELTDRYLERGNVIKPLVACMVAGQHSLLLGPPGTAKSELARDLTGRIEGGRLWEIGLSKYTDPKKMFGPIDVSALMQGTYQQVWDGRATRADIAFIDEIFKCGPAALNELLAYLNERLYHPEAGGDPIACPLISAITASNELPSGDESAAVYDRLLVRIEVDYLADPGNFAELLRSATAPTATPAPPTTVPLADLRTAVTVHVPRVGLPDPVVDAMVKLRSALREAGLVSSDRRWKQSVRLLQAAAWIDGRSDVRVDDLELLTNVLWDDPMQRPTVERLLLELVNPDARDVLDLGDALTQLEAGLTAMAGKSRQELSDWAIKEATVKLSTSGRKLQELRSRSEAAGRSTASVDEVIAKHRALYRRVMSEALGVDVDAGL